MKLTVEALVIIIFTFYFSSSNAQVQTLFNDKIELKSMVARWELDSTSARGTFLVTPYKSIYVLPFVWSNNVNEQPISGNESPDYVAPKLDYDVVELKFQLSFKTKILPSFLWGKADLWVAYTQKSFWQIYNTELSRPFREINYEPEVILNFPVKFSFFGFKTRMVGIAFNHLSNGKSEPFSRSLNRVILQAGLERKNWTVYVRSWYGMSDYGSDNPDISDYMGRGDLSVIYAKNGNVFSFIGGYNMKFNSNPKGSSEFSWSYPIKNNLKGFLQISHGYGESLIDYNHLQTTVGLGVSLIE